MDSKDLAAMVNRLLENRRYAIANDLVDFVYKRCDTWEDAQYVTQLVWMFFQHKQAFKIPKKWKDGGATG